MLSSYEAFNSFKASKDTHKNLIYNCKTALKNKNVKTGIATHFIPYHPIKQQSVIFTKIFNAEIVSKYTLRCTESCVWISVNTNMYFWCYVKKKPRFSVSTFPTRPWFYYPFYQHPLSIKTRIVDWGNELVYFFKFKILSQPKSCVYFQSISQKNFEFYIKLFIINEFI